MPNRTLTADELAKLARPLLAEIRDRLNGLSGGDPQLLFALRRKIYKELSFDERGTPMKRRLLRAAKYAEQQGKCALCSDTLEPMGKNGVLDRAEAMDGYVNENVRLICAKCDRRVQESRNYS